MDLRLRLGGCFWVSVAVFLAQGLETTQQCIKTHTQKQQQAAKVRKQDVSEPQPSVSWPRLCAVQDGPCSRKSLRSSFQM